MIDLKQKMIESIMYYSNNYKWYIRFEKYPFLRYIFRDKHFLINLFHKTDMLLMSGCMNVLTYLEK